MREKEQTPPEEVFVVSISEISTDPVLATWLPPLIDDEKGKLRDSKQVGLKYNPQLTWAVLNVKTASAPVLART